jgi:hypothetical protein
MNPNFEHAGIGEYNAGNEIVARVPLTVDFKEVGA